MKPLIIASALVASGLLAACSETTATTSVNPTFMTPSEMTDYCRGEAAGRYSTRPDSVTVGSPQSAVDGGYVVTGGVDRGTLGSAPFECRFGLAGNFVTLNEL